jgi:hypothetical protein
MSDISLKETLLFRGETPPAGRQLASHPGNIPLTGSKMMIISLVCATLEPAYSGGRVDRQERG